MPDAFMNYKVKAFGFRNVPVTFQHLVNIVPAGMPGCDAYLDDVVVYIKEWSEHLGPLQELFHRLSNANLTIKLGKTGVWKGYLYLVRASSWQRANPASHG